MENNIWTELYDKEILDEKNKVLNEIKEWLNNFKINKKKILLIIGLNGVGKTKIINKLLLKENYNIYNFNILDFLNRKKIKDDIERIMITQNIYDIINVNKKKIIVIDEIEGINLNTKLLLDIMGDFNNLHKKKNILEKKEKIKKEKSKKEINKIYNKNIPIICIATETYLKKMNDLQRFCDIIKFPKPQKKDMLQKLKYILKDRNIKLKKELINEIIQESNYNYNKMINKLQYIYYTNIDNLNKKKYIETNILNILDKTSNNSNIVLYKSCENLLYEKINMENTLIYYNIEKVLLPLMIHENYISVIFNRFKNKNEIFNIILKISKLLSNSDLINNYIFNNHNWDLQESYALLSCYFPSYLINERKRKKKENEKIKIKFTSILSKISIYHVNLNQYNYICRTLKNNDNEFDYIIIKYICRKILYYLFSSKQENLIKGLKLLKYYNLNVKDISKLIKFSNIIDYDKLFNKKLCHFFKKESLKIE